MAQWLYTERSFPAGINIYTGNVQGGHAYASIKLGTDYSNRYEVQRIIDDEWLKVLEECNPEEAEHYRALKGHPTTRLLNTDEAHRLAVEWMKANHPHDRLVHEDWYLTDGQEGEIMYVDPDCPHGPNEPCTCDGCHFCTGHVVGCTCDINWDAITERRLGL